jgi:methionyl-tRNA formyltransferase
LKQYKFIYPSSAKQPKDYLMFNAEKAVECFANYIDGPLHDTNAKVDIDWNNSTYWPRLRADTNGWINWSWSAEHIISFIKAFSHPYGGARTLLNGKTVLIFDAEIACKAEYHPFACGLILRAKSELKFVAVRDALIKLNLTYIEGKPKGTKTVGSRLFTPSSLLEQSLESIVTTQELNRRAEIEN